MALVAEINHAFTIKFSARDVQLSSITNEESARYALNNTSEPFSPQCTCFVVCAHIKPLLLFFILSCLATSLVSHSFRYLTTNKSLSSWKSLMNATVCLLFTVSWHVLSSAPFLCVNDVRMFYGKTAWILWWSCNAVCIGCRHICKFSAIKSKLFPHQLMESRQSTMWNFLWTCVCVAFESTRLNLQVSSSCHPFKKSDFKSGRQLTKERKTKHLHRTCVNGVLYSLSMTHNIRNTTIEYMYVVQDESFH